MKKPKRTTRKTKPTRKVKPKAKSAAKAKGKPTRRKKGVAAKAKGITAKRIAPVATRGTWDDFFSDVSVFGRCAIHQDEKDTSRQAALNVWANEDIDRLERVDGGGLCGWAMWRR